MLNILTLIFFSILVFGQEFTESQRQFIKAENILKNPGGENGRTDWTLTSGILASESTILVSGKRSLKITLTAQALSLHQDSTLYQAQFADGVQGLVSVRVKTTVSGIRVCSRQNGVVSSNLCVNVQANGKWGLYKVPFTLGGTSNGISINSNGTSVTGDVYVDDAFVGAVDLAASQSFDTTCETISCQTVFSAKISSSAVVTEENADWINANCSGSGSYSCTFNSSIFTVAPNCTATVSTNFTFGISDMVPTSTGLSYLGRNTNNGATAAIGVNIICQKQGADYTAALAAQKAFQKSKVSSFSSTNADTDWQSCGHTTSSFTGFGTVTAIETQCKRQGSDLLMRGKFTSGTPTAVEARVSLPIWNGFQLVSAGTQKIPSIQVAGIAGRNTASGASYHTLIEPNVSYFTFSRIDTPDMLSKITGSTFVSSGNTVTYQARIPIEGWDNSNIIIGQFNGLESCTDTYQCTDVFSAKVSAAGVVSDENIDWINGNGSGTNPMVLTFRSGIFTVIPNCFLTDSSARIVGFDATSLSSVSVNMRTTAGVTGVDQPFTIICQKQGVDYIGKTAKAVASDQNLMTPSVTNAVFISAEISSAGVVSQEDSDFINGSCAVTDTSLYTCTWNTGYWALAPKCMPNITNGSQNFKADKEAIPTTTSGVFRTANSTTGAKSASGFTLFCHGVKL